MLGIRALRNNIAEENVKGEFARGETNFLRVDLGVSRSGSLPATGATSVRIRRLPIRYTTYSTER